MSNGLQTRKNVYEQLIDRVTSVAVIGLGYVGLPVAVALAQKVRVIGFDLNRQKIASYQAGIDLTGDLEPHLLTTGDITFTSDEAALRDASIFIIAVPTPIGSGHVPDLSFVERASELVGKYITKDAIVVYESTVYPGVTEEVCLPILERVSGLSCPADFKIGYSPERINPGDKQHKLHNIIKIVSGIDDQSLDLIANMYELIIDAGVYRAESIQTAEAAKVIENAQRDVNIAFMNELAMVFEKMGISTQAVIKAAATKWNFLPFQPGLVGGHCIGIDPYYLTYKAEDSGHPSKIILAGRQINDQMGNYVAQQIVKRMNRLKIDSTTAKVAILGLSYKANSNDIRNTKVIDIIKELQDFGIQTYTCDPLVDADEVYQQYNIRLQSLEQMKDMDVLIIAVPHHVFLQWQPADFAAMFGSKRAKLIVDLQGEYEQQLLEEAGYHYWSL